MSSLVAQTSDVGGGGLAVYLVVWLAFLVFYIAAWWKVFVKAGQPGWAAIIPIYNFIVLLKVARRPLWWFFLILIPFVNFVVLIIINIDVAKNFGKTTGFGVGLVLLGWIFYPILGFGSATYQPLGNSALPMPPMQTGPPPPPPMPS